MQIQSDCTCGKLAYEPSKEIGKIMEMLQDWVNHNPKGGIGIIHAPRVLANMRLIEKLARTWLEKSENKLLEAKK